MEEIFVRFANAVALWMEVIAIVIILIGALQALWQLLTPAFRKQWTDGIRRKAWSGFARWLLLGLEFTLAADIVRTAIAPTWDSIGQLASIAVIRTFLNYFLEKDLEGGAYERRSEIHAA